MAVIHTLVEGDEIPTGAPRRYLSSHGYVRLRWRIGTGQLVEVYEHRLVCGLPPSHLDVHHLDGRKDHNDRSNLVVLTKTEHTELHAALEALAWPDRHLRFGGYRSAEAQARATRRLAREEARRVRVETIRTLRAEGRGVVEIGAMLGIHNSAVSRYAVHGHQ